MSALDVVVGLSQDINYVLWQVVRHIPKRFNIVYAYSMDPLEIDQHTE